MTEARNLRNLRNLRNIRKNLISCLKGISMTGIPF
nr:MAG TPA: hypothetical protein [Caudoviricetes sp.]